MRLKALELLGKRRGVNLFTDSLEITVKQKPTEDIEGELTILLEKYMGKAEVIDNDKELRPLVDLDKELAVLDDPALFIPELEETARVNDSPSA